ncbi:hypothetical protein ACLOJK_012647 [Asimina triloba]
MLSCCAGNGRNGDHWTARCGYKGVNLHEESLLVNGPATPEAHDPVPVVKYVHPMHRVGKDCNGKERKYKDEGHTLRDADLFELFRAIGSVKSVCVSTYSYTHISKGFGFVTFFRKEDAERSYSEAGWSSVGIQVKVKEFFPS